MKTTVKLLLLFYCFNTSAQVNLKLSLFAQNLNQITGAVSAGDSRLFVLDQSGIINILNSDGAKNPVPFLNITSKVNFGGEMGLLGLAFHPNYQQNGYFFVYYIDKNQNSVISRFSVSQSDPNLANSTETIFLTFPQPYTNHNGGDIAFGSDGFLYICSGDGGSGGDPQDYGQNLNTFLGKILRIDVNTPANSLNYSIPSTNPFIDGTGPMKDEIWSWGWRNPWRFSFDKLTGDMWIGDVGQGLYEEIDMEPVNSAGGKNYGWRCYEGNHVYNSTNCPAASTLTFPVHEYPHSEGCSVTGGFVYRGSNNPQLYGRYLYADFCSRKIWSLKNVNGNWVNELLYQESNNTVRFSTFGQNNNGELFIGDINGRLFQICDASWVQTTPDLTLNYSPILNGNYQAGYNLFSNGTLQNSSNVGFYAYSSIQLNPGFKADNGTVFKANVSFCKK
jgi:glucose/arabinose dehydrogenase